MTERTRGRLIVFEGVEGAGKSTQLQRLAGHLARAGVTHRVFREPGGTPLGDSIRTLILDPASTVAPRAEALLFMASRAQLVAQELRPALEAGTTVLLDRFFLSTYAYQIVGRGLAESDVRSANMMATHGLVPDLTLLLTLSADVGLARAGRRSGLDRIEGSGREFHERVEEAFAEFATRDWQRSHEECGPIVALEAGGAPDTVEALVLDAVASRFGELRSALGVTA
ncbi:MAG TPA: dTMP kinase [Gemmatimonadaceae bacterium]|nr:dTMP kinase [Gemmatimonadaceae bacterium]